MWELAVNYARVMLFPRPAAALTLAVAAATAVPAWSQTEADPFEGLEFRLVGPSRGGRVTAVAGHTFHPYTFYMGSTGGGVWRTTNAGRSWQNLTDDDLGAGSVGAVAVAPSDPNVIYVGTGSACPRGNVSIGDGMYRSTDAGASWQHIGLERAGAISRIRIHPGDPNRLWVAVLGQIFGSNPERGVYRSTDGGETWEHVLYISDDAGMADLELDPFNPRVLYAAAWRVERKPLDPDRRQRRGRPVPLHRRRRHLGPARRRPAVGRARPDRRLRLAGAARPAVDDHHGRGRPRRHLPLRGPRRLLEEGERRARAAHPRLVLQPHLRRSRRPEHGLGLQRPLLPLGRRRRQLGARANAPRRQPRHLDQPRATPHHRAGDDGGANVSLDGGRSWSTQNNQPTAEFYRVTVDNQFPYRIYGAQQDNSTISVPSRPMPQLTATQHWHSVAGAESGHIAVHPEQPHLVYSGNYLGRIDRYDHRSGTARNMILYPEMQDGTAPVTCATGSSGTRRS